ncbi:uncharacterized protein LOC121598770 [Anopheles merus]|uniref:uncharacterized protein LOC121598770 n=1 Tax=Anopheles merus TaxID=30066 RepID=UPI001BE41759|nr:uncharacterized protein LOC121598770 [Anopheles merus]
MAKPKCFEKQEQSPSKDSIAPKETILLVPLSLWTCNRVFQECLDMSCFPQPWKKQRLVLLPKPGKSSGEQSSFRPICLIDNTGQALERLLLNRLNEHIEDPESPPMSEQHFGFRRGRSTLQAIQQVVDAGREAKSFGRTNNREWRCFMVVALDVRNAFNTASWQSIAEALQAKGIPAQLRRILQDYFADRELVYDTADGPVTRRVSAGVPQGSILGPALWNIMYDGVLAVELPEGVSIVGFADDLAILAAGTTPEHAAAIAEEAVAAVNSWMVRHKLSLAPEKTELLMISSKRSGYRNIPVNICGVEVRSKRSIRYLGVMLHVSFSRRTALPPPGEGRRPLLQSTAVKPGQQSRGDSPGGKGFPPCWHAVLARAAANEAAEPTEEVEEEELQYRRRRRAGELGDVPQGRQRRGRIPPSAAELERRRLNRRQRERQRRLEQRQAEVEAQPPPWDEMPSSQLAERRFGLTEDERAAVTSANPWKKQRLVLLPKPGKSSGEQSSFRPICLIDNTGQALERLLLNRLNEHIEDPESPPMSEQHFGFRRGRSTLQAIQQVVDAGREAKSFGRTNNREWRCFMVVALDVRNAFNTASWQSIAEALQAKGIPAQLRRILQDYFADRELVYDTADGPVTRRVSAGVPQGSILGPALWNIIGDNSRTRRGDCGGSGGSGQQLDVLAGELPYHLLVKEDARCYNRLQLSPDSSREAIRQEEKETSLQLWQQQWDDVAANNNSRYLRWAHRQVPDVRLWTGRKHGEVDFYLSQVLKILSGHAFVHEFLHVFGFAPSPDCPRCAGSVETVAHVMFECPRFADVRAEYLQGVDEHNLGSRLLESAEWWDRIQQAARRIFSVLQEDWREEQQNLAAAEAAQPDPALSPPEDIVEAERRRLMRRLEVRNRSARRRRQQQRQQRLGDFELAPAVLARAAANEAAEPTGEVEEEELQYRRRRRAGELGDVPQGRQRRGRIPPSAAELERRRLNRRQRERQRRLEQRQAEVEAQPPPWDEMPSSQLAERRSGLTEDERAAVTSANVPAH